MDRDALPPIYHAAESASAHGQEVYLRFSRWNLIALVLAALLSLEPASLAAYTAWFRVGVAALMCVSAVLTGVPLVRGYRDRWYLGRAVAESVKTLTWRFTAGSEPFPLTMAQKDADAVFATKLREIIAEAEVLGVPLTPKVSAGPEITRSMRGGRARSFADRRDIYIQGRIENQQRWYSTRAAECESMAERLGLAILLLQILALAVSVTLVALPQLRVNPVGVITTAAAALMAWVELKRFDELSRAYATAAHELGVILSQAPHVDEESFPSFVADSEQAISREHTLWIARRLSRIHTRVQP